MTRAMTGTALDRLRQDHPGYLIDFRHFLDGPRYDARPLDERQPRIVTRTAQEMDDAIAAAGDGAQP